MKTKELRELLPEREMQRGWVTTLDEAAGPVELYHEGNFTLALLRDRYGNLTFGMAKRNPCDPLRDEVGERIAAVRLFRRFLRKGWS